MAQAMAEQPISGRNVQGARDGTSADSGDLTTLVRRWLAVPRTSRDSRSPSRPEQVPETAPPADIDVVLPTRIPGAALSVELHVEPALERVDGTGATAGAPGNAGPAALARPAARTRREDGGASITRIPRLAVLIDAGTTPQDVAPRLFELLEETGDVSLRRAYGDWTGPRLEEWLPRLRHLRIQPVHHFSDHEATQADDQGLVTMTIDAVDIAREGAVDVVVVVGDLRSTPPLVTRLHEAGLQVLAVGPDHTPYAVRAACDDFVALASLTATQPLGEGRHRA